MPKYVIPEVSDYNFVELLNRISKEKPAKDFRFEPGDKRTLLGYLAGYFVPSGGIITEPRKNQAVGRFKDSPSKVDFLFDDWKSFREKIEDEMEGSIPAPTLGPPKIDYELGLRVYIGKNSTDSKYSIVIVPMYVPLIDGIYDRTLEKEKAFFTLAGVPFFALLGSESGGVLSYDETLCTTRIIQKDAYNREVAYFTFKDFCLFADSLKDTPVRLQTEFARTTDGFATIVFSFLNAGGDEIESEDPQLGKGVYFDQGDLIPPPPNSGGLRDTFFPR